MAARQLHAMSCCSLEQCERLKLPNSLPVVFMTANVLLPLTAYEFLGFRDNTSTTP